MSEESPRVGEDARAGNGAVNAITSPFDGSDQASPADMILARMKSSRRWLIWKPIERTRGDGTKRIDKVPFYASGKPREKPLDGPGDVAQLVTYGEAMGALHNRRGYNLGFALGPDGDGGYWQGIDLDHVVANKLVELANRLPGYVEYSPSGGGAHAIGYGAQFRNLDDDGSGLEAYCGGRYFTFTGNRIGGAS